MRCSFLAPWSPVVPAWSSLSLLICRAQDPAGKAHCPLITHVGLYSLQPRTLITLVIHLAIQVRSPSPPTLLLPGETITCWCHLLPGSRLWNCNPEWVGKFNAFLISGLSLGQGSWYFYCEGLSPLVIIEIHNIHQRSLILLLWKEQHPDQPPEGFLSQSNQIICNLNKSFYKHVPSQLSIT